MKKKLIRVANQIYILEEKIQRGENVVESMTALEDLMESEVENNIKINQDFKGRVYIMRAICCVLISFVCFYIATNMNADENKGIATIFILCSLLSLLISIVLMIIGL